MNTIIRINFILKKFVLEIFVQQYFRSYQMCAIYSLYIVILVKNLHKNFRHFTQNENFLTMKFSRIMVVQLLQI